MTEKLLKRLKSTPKIVADEQLYFYEEMGLDYISQ